MIGRSTDTILLANLKATISAERMKTYDVAASSDEQVIVMYFWNQLLSESLYSSLGFLEIALRNAIHRVMSARFGVERWIPLVLTGSALSNHNRDVSEIARRYGVGHSTGQIIAGMSFGKWVHMLKVAKCNWVTERPYPLFEVFPNYPNRFAGDRDRIHEHLHYILELRNRVMHHEPIFRGVRLPNKSMKPIEQIHFEIFEAIGWIDAELMKTASHVDRFHENFVKGRVRIAEDLPQRYENLKLSH